MGGFSTLCWLAFVAMLIGFNVFVGNTILELRRDIQIIRKRLGAERKKTKRGEGDEKEEKKTSSAEEASASSSAGGADDE